MIVVRQTAGSQRKCVNPGLFLRGIILMNYFFLKIVKSLKIRPCVNSNWIQKVLKINKHAAVKTITQ